MSKSAAEAIIQYLSDRKGFDGFWDSIDDDIQEEIIDEIAEIIEDHC